VTQKLLTHDRGKLIMACGTGKTFTSLRIAEQMVGIDGNVLFLVPSIQLLSQSLREWMANRELDIRPFAVCSDVRVGRKVDADEADMSPIDLAEPATTNSMTLLARMTAGKPGRRSMNVVFSTYQSIDVVIEAQEQGLADFDLVVCDEAHRTAGVTRSGDEASVYLKIHDAAALRAKKRLYMTATPKVFGDEARRKATDADAVLADMADESVYGPELHHLGFGNAVEAGLLTDYKVLVLAVDEEYVAENFQKAMSEAGEIKIDEAAKLIGCWNGLSKNFGPEHGDAGGSPMRTAVAFAKDIKSSETAASAFPTMVERAIVDLPKDRTELRVEARHVDGTMGIHERNRHLAWLKGQASADAGLVCRILTNAKCLSEGVDVPTLDAVLFLTPRGSQVDVVQSVGRVMRKAPGKELGYIVLPVVVPTGIAPEDALNDNERYKVVWQVLQALRSHDDRFHALVNKLELNKSKPTDKLDIISVTNPTDGDQDAKLVTPADKNAAVQRVLEFSPDAFRDAMYARIVQKVGERRYWENWAKDIAAIAAAHITRINGLLADPTSEPARQFEVFLAGLRGNLNDGITADEAIDMLAQHLVTRPIFEALFEGYDFAATNPVARAMERMLATLDEHSLDAENAKLESFYTSVRRRVAGVDDAAGKQKILVELYDKFFRVAFKKTVDRLGIVYTPIEIVDFILRSAEAVLRQEFGQGLTDEGVHVLDGFAGTGTFLVRLLQSGLIKPEDLARKYTNELHSNEILLLAYYIACVNIETTYADLTGSQEPFPGLILTDTFQSWEPGDRPGLDVFPENNARLAHLKSLPITVIVGNPPYSVGQTSANDNNANEKYPALDDEIRRTYADRSAATNKNSLYNSYIRAIKWASLRIKDRGVVVLVTPNGLLDANSADGFRKAIAEEFANVYVFDLKGNQKGDWRKEGEKIFGEGSQVGICVITLVKDRRHVPPAAVHYGHVGDYLDREAKLSRIATAESILEAASTVITPNGQGDWLNQRTDDFAAYLPLGDKSDIAVVDLYSAGVKTNRDAWCYSFSSDSVTEQMRLLLRTYSTDVAAGRTSQNATTDARLISWNRSLFADLDRRRHHDFREGALRVGMYRPFTKQHLYFDRNLNDMVYRLPSLFPSPLAGNVGIYQVGAGSDVPFSVLVSDTVPNVHLTGAGSGGQFFSRWRYEQADGYGTLDLGEGELFDGYRRIDNITDKALARFGAAYPDVAITKDDIFNYVYGLLHSPTYRSTYAADLKKVLPRIPFVADFRGFAEAGRRLSELHLGYESVTPYELLATVSGTTSPLAALSPAGDPYTFFAVRDKKMRFGRPTAEQRAAGEKHDSTTMHYNDRITLTGIPADAYRYMLGSRSAIEWIIDRYWVKTDKDSGIVNDPNDWSREVGNPRYIIDLVARIVTVSLETMNVVDNLPPLDITEEER